LPVQTQISQFKHLSTPFQYLMFDQDVFEECAHV